MTRLKKIKLNMIWTEIYEYLTGEDLGYNPDVIQKAKFEYSPLGKVFNEELNESDKKEGLLKRLKNIDGKDEQQFKEIKDQEKKQLHIFSTKTGQVDDFQNIFFRKKLSSEAKIVYEVIKEQSNKLVCISSGKHQYNFTIFLDLKTLAETLYNGSFPLKVAKLKQSNMEDEIKRLDYYQKNKNLGHKKKILFIMQENFTKEEK